MSQELISDYLTSISDSTPTECEIDIVPLKNIFKARNSNVTPKLILSNNPGEKVATPDNIKLMEDSLTYYTPKDIVEFYGTLSEEILLKLNPSFFSPSSSAHSNINQYYNWALNYLIFHMKKIFYC